MPSWARNSATPKAFGGTVSGGVEASIFALIAIGGKNLSLDQSINALTAAPANFTPYSATAKIRAAMKASPTFSPMGVGSGWSATRVPTSGPVREAEAEAVRVKTVSDTVHRPGPRRPRAENRPASGRDR